MSKQQHFRVTSGETSPALGLHALPCSLRQGEGGRGWRENVKQCDFSSTPHPSPAYGIYLPLLGQPVFITCCVPGFLLGLPPSFPTFGALPP